MSHCPKTYKSISELKRYEGNHTGEKQFACSNCDKAFKTSSELKNHEMCHSGQIGELKKNKMTHLGGETLIVNNQWSYLIKI